MGDPKTIRELRNALHDITCQYASALELLASIDDDSVLDLYVNRAQRLEIGAQMARSVYAASRSDESRAADEVHTGLDIIDRVSDALSVMLERCDILDGFGLVHMQRIEIATQIAAQIFAGPAADSIAARDNRYNEDNWAEVVALNAYEMADTLIAFIR